MQNLDHSGGFITHVHGVISPLLSVHYIVFPLTNERQQALKIRAQLKQILKGEQWSSRTYQGPCHCKGDPPATLICISFQFLSSLFHFPLYLLLMWLLTQFHGEMAEILFLALSPLDGMSGYLPQVGYWKPHQKDLVHGQQKHHNRCLERSLCWAA